MSLLTKVFISFTIVLFFTTTMKNMQASNQINDPDLEQLNKIEFIYKNMSENEISMASFLNNEVSLNECKVIFKENDFKNLHYSSCGELVNDLNISSLDKKTALESNFQ